MKSVTSLEIVKSCVTAKSAGLSNVTIDEKYFKSQDTDHNNLMVLLKRIG